MHTILEIYNIMLYMRSMLWEELLGIIWRLIKPRNRIDKISILKMILGFMMISKY